MTKKRRNNNPRCARTELPEYATREAAEYSLRRRTEEYAPPVRLTVEECRGHWHVRGPGCKGKRRYGTYDHAIKVVLGSARHAGRPLSIYRCAVCEKFHLTSHPRRARA